MRRTTLASILTLALACAVPAGALAAKQPFAGTFKGDDDAAVTFSIAKGKVSQVAVTGLDFECTDGSKGERSFEIPGFERFFPVRKGVRGFVATQSFPTRSFSVDGRLYTAKNVVRGAATFNFRKGKLVSCGVLDPRFTATPFVEPPPPTPEPTPPPSPY